MVMLLCCAPSFGVQEFDQLQLVPPRGCLHRLLGPLAQSIPSQPSCISTTLQDFTLLQAAATRSTATVSKADGVQCTMCSRHAWRAPPWPLLRLPLPPVKFSAGLSSLWSLCSVPGLAGAGVVLHCDSGSLSECSYLASFLQIIIEVRLVRQQGRGGSWLGQRALRCCLAPRLEVAVQLARRLHTAEYCRQAHRQGSDVHIIISVQHCSERLEQRALRCCLAPHPEVAEQLAHAACTRHATHGRLPACIASHGPHGPCKSAVAPAHGLGRLALAE